AQTLSSGGNFDGTILLNHTNTWTFTATSGDRIVLRGAELTTTNRFRLWLRIYDPNGVLVGDSGVNGDVVVQELALTATNSGTFTVLVSDSNGINNHGFGGTGNYRLYFAPLPLPDALPNSAQTLSSGGNFDGTILLNHTNTWTFTATSGDRIVLRGAEL